MVGRRAYGTVFNSFKIKSPSGASWLVADAQNAADVSSLIYWKGEGHLRALLTPSHCNRLVEYMLPL